MVKDKRDTVFLNKELCEETRYKIFRRKQKRKMGGGKILFKITSFS